ncbi:MAG: VWA domain-containing protein [Desulfatitalea sp.]
MQKHVMHMALRAVCAAAVFLLATTAPFLTASFAADGAASREASSTKRKDKARLVLVLDASGSMWGQINGRAKIDIAKAAMAELIAAIPADFQTGLMVYGHRHKADCNDIEMVIPVGPHNSTAMKNKVQAINPKGKTPLSEAVRQAAQALRYTEERATVILVSDGLESCDIDPCKLAADLAMSGVDFTVHVVGFDISKEDQGRLRCLADKTGGLFLAASDAGSLRDALFKTVEEVKAPPPPVVENPGAATLQGPAGVPVGSAFTVRWQGPDSRDDYIAIAEKRSQELSYADYSYTKRGNPVDLTAPGKEGEYELRYIHAQSRKVIGRADIKVTPVQATVQTPAEANVAVAFDVQWQGPAYSGDYITIARPDQPPAGYLNYTYTSQGSPLKLQAPSDPGTYEVRYILGQGAKLLAKTTIAIKAVGASVQAPASANMAGEFEVTWQGPGNPDDYITIAGPDQPPDSYLHYTYTREGSPLKLQAPPDPGTYEVRYILGQGGKLLAKTTIAIKTVSAKVSPPASAAAGTQFEVAWQGPGYASDYITIATPDQAPDSYIEYVYVQSNPAKLSAPKEPGVYEVRYILSEGSQVLSKATITIK